MRKSQVIDIRSKCLCLSYKQKLALDFGIFELRKITRNYYVYGEIAVASVHTVCVCVQCSIFVLPDTLKMSQVVEDNVILSWAAAGTVEPAQERKSCDFLVQKLIRCESTLQPIHIHQMDGKWMAKQEIEEEAANAKWPKTKLHTVRT